MIIFPPAIALLLINMASMTNKDLILVLQDAKHFSDRKLLQQLPTTIFDTQHFLHILEDQKSDCSASSDHDLKTGGGMMNEAIRGKIFFIEIANDVTATLEKVLSGMAGTVVDCPLVVRPGYYDRNNVFLYYDNNNNNNSISTKLFKDFEVKRHRYVGLLNDMSAKVFMSRFNVYSDMPAKSIVTPSSSNRDDDACCDLDQLFPDFALSGFTFRLSALPYDAYVTADRDDRPASDKRVFVNHRDGLEIRMMQAFSSILDFK